MLALAMLRLDRVFNIDTGLFNMHQLQPAPVSSHQLCYSPYAAAVPPRPVDVRIDVVGVEVDFYRLYFRRSDFCIICLLLISY